MARTRDNYVKPPKAEILAMLDRLERGETLRSILIDKPYPRSTFHQWITEDDELSGRYALAQDFRAEQLADEIEDVSRNADGEILRNRLLADSLKWKLSKMKPRVYGDTQQVQLSGDVRITRSKETTDRAVRAAGLADD